jgi:arabinan endo-1,5-alpha-L-arabinosidase
MAGSFATRSLFVRKRRGSQAACGSRSDYKIAVGRSPLITGPYTDEKGTPMNEGGGSIVLESYDDAHCPGHCSVLRESDRDLLVHHMYDGKRGGAPILQLRPITWSADGWPRVGQPLADR